MDYIEIVNSFTGLAHEQLTELELDILVLNEFGFEVELGGWTQYFDSYCGDNVVRLREAANRHSLHQLIDWIDRVSAESNEIISGNRDIRSIAISKMSDEIYKRFEVEGFQLAEKAIDLWEELAQNNLTTLEAGYKARKQRGA